MAGWLDVAVPEDLTRSLVVAFVEDPETLFTCVLLDRPDEPCVLFDAVCEAELLAMGSLCVIGADCRVVEPEECVSLLRDVVLLALTPGVDAENPVRSVDELNIGSDGWLGPWGVEWFAVSAIDGLAL